MARGASKVLLSVTDLKKYFPVQRGFLERLLARKVDYIKAVDGISFQVKKGEVLALVGESGCGKTTTARLILRLIDPTDGRIVLEGRDITFVKGEELRKLRRQMQIIFQDPYASLNPYMTVGSAVEQPLEIHEDLTKSERKERVIEMLEKVGLTPGEKFYNLYPHQLSGGQRQRVALARAIVLNPKLVIADEPVSMIDVSMRALILELMMSLKREFDLTYLFITHDLAVAKYISNKIAIMYLGKIVEIGRKEDIFSAPRHPYTLALLSAVPVPKPGAKRKRVIIRGEVPSSPIDVPPGCRFHPRCPYAQLRCSSEEPTLECVEKDHLVACHLVA